MLNAIWWFITAEAIGLAVFPLAYFLFPRLRDRGYSLTKPIGLLLVGYLSWILAWMHVLPSVRLSIVAMLVVIAAVSARLAWSRRRELAEFIARERTVILVTEGIFVAVFLTWVLYRAFDPSISHTEKPMDFAFLNASVRTVFGTPEDPWLSGGSISYYYLGHWMMSVMTKLTGVAPSISYNLALALIPAMGLAAVFGLVYNMVSLDRGRRTWAIAGGLLAALVLGFVANLEGVLEFMRANAIGSQGFFDWIGIEDLDGPSAAATQSWRPDDFWWWWRASRVINTFDGGVGLDYTIQEFPFFSFILGDLHPHMMSIPFVMVFLSLCLHLLLSRTMLWTGTGVARYAPVVAIGVSLGALGMTNAWDLPVFSVLLVAVLLINAYSMHARETLGNLLAAGRSVPAARRVLHGLTRWGDASGVAASVRGPYQRGGPPSRRSLRRERRPEAALPTAAAPTGSIQRSLAVATALWLAVMLLGLVLFAPYYLSFASQFNGIYPVTAATTRPVHMFLIWGLAILAVAPFVVAAFWRTTVERGWAGMARLALAVGFLPYVVWAMLHLVRGGEGADLAGRFFHVLPFGLAIAITVYTGLWLARRGASAGMLFAVVLSALGLLLIMGPELLYVGDFFGTRMNTVFKFYYQAWMVLAVASGFVLYYWSSLRHSLSTWKRLLAYAWAAGFIVLLAGSLYYPAAAAASKGALAREAATLDGLAYVQQSDPGEFDAIQFLRANAERGSVIVEAVYRYCPDRTPVCAKEDERFGGDYLQFGRISASTGIPTVVGWVGHEHQWRGGSDAPFVERARDVATIYETLDVEEAKTLLDRYDVDYVYVGARERQTQPILAWDRGKPYEPEGLDKFESFMETVFSSDGVVVYRLRGEE